MITIMTFVYGAFNILGGMLGAWIMSAPLRSGAIAAATGFVVICVLEFLGWQQEWLLTLIFIAVAAAVALAMRLTVRQVVGIVLGAYLGSLLLHFFIGAWEGFAESAAGRS